MIQTIHETDLYRPHCDPDDHWDLACQFALAKKGLIDLRGILIDYPPELSYGDPDIIAVNQLGWLTDIAVPVGVGQKSDGKKKSSGIALLEKTLTEAKEPVTLHIVGSSRDIARFGNAHPDLFREKVRALYLNAGSGVNTGALEYNVGLDIESYTGIFNLPCPVYWMPCFHAVYTPEDRKDTLSVGRYGTFFRFRQSEIFDHLSAPVLNYFLSMLTRTETSRWLKALEGPVDENAKAYYGDKYRCMWCTGGFLHAVGLTVWKDGSIHPLGENAENEVFGFTPIDITATADGRTHWLENPASETRFIYTVNDAEAYEPAMTKALGEMVCWLG